MHLPDAAPVPANAEDYAKMVRRDSALREEVITLQRALESVLQPGTDPLMIAQTLADAGQALARDFAPATVTQDAIALRAQVQPVEWLVEDLLPAESLILLAGDGGIGKTWLACHLAGQVALGESLFARFDVPEARPVLYWDEENGSRILASRLSAMYSGRCPPDWHFIVDRQWYLTDPTTLPRLERLVEDHGVGLLVIDSFRAVHDLNENDNGAMGPLMNDLRRFTRRAKCSILLLHHTNKPGMIQMSASDRSRGATAIRDGVDVYLYAKRLSRETFSVEMDKNRVGGGLLAPFVLAFESPAEGMIEVRYMGMADDIMEPTERAQEAITSLLAMRNGWVEKPDIIAECRGHGISERSAKRAIAELVTAKRICKGLMRGHKRLYALSALEAGKP